MTQPFPIKQVARIFVIFAISAIAFAGGQIPHSSQQEAVSLADKMSERTYIMISIHVNVKCGPDGVERGLVGEIIKRFEQKGYKLAGLKIASPSKQLLEEHYKDLAGKPFFPRLVEYMMSGPVVGMVWQGKEVVKTGRVMLGATNPLASAPGTIRGDFCIDVGKNLCHGSDSVESAEREIKLWFPEGTLDYKRHVDSLIYE
ncbi:nucleoside-diphosphate kinase [Synchytrium endobioticum]|uniref:Nucleoside diphosphate kinase n=1 Tax=Synchytrium endobioticum TaxID=286115 RepID=A0A507D7Z1_9FUNG|nr:nucleoside-diphosphate kinase [Synchytrium endobioticum]TPX49881.1 nucleoside-diphosphate kinase [Synchytrium endobioticum]